VEGRPSTTRGRCGRDAGGEVFFDRNAASIAAIAPRLWTDVGSPARGRFIMLDLLRASP
jgi:hypothetical protein